MNTIDQEYRIILKWINLKGIWNKDKTDKKITENTRHQAYSNLNFSLYTHTSWQHNVKSHWSAIYIALWTPWPNTRESRICRRVSKGDRNPLFASPSTTLSAKLSITAWFISLQHPRRSVYCVCRATCFANGVLLSRGRWRSLAVYRVMMCVWLSCLWNVFYVVCLILGCIIVWLIMYLLTVSLSLSGCLFVGLSAD